MRPGLIGLACVLLAACGSEAPPDVLVIVMDTVRADHLSCYGYARPTSPNLDALAARADRYTEARSTAPWTLPSHASLFTGKFPHEHGVDGREAGGQRAHELPDEEVTLAEALARLGYRTGAFAANRAHVNPRSGLDQGFETFENPRVRAPELSRQALAWLDEGGAANGGKPVFLFLNYMDAHRKYNVEPLAPERAAELPTPPPGDVGRLLDRLAKSVLGSDMPPDPELQRLAVDAYDLGIANLDEGLRILFEGLERRGRLGRALVVITSDHGEFFGEHDQVEHGQDVYETVLRVPLIVKRPGVGEGRVIETPISLADVPALVFRLLPAGLAGGVPFPAASRERGLLAELRKTSRRNLTANINLHPRRERLVVYEGSWKLIHSSDGDHELYDLAADPAEAENLYEERRDLAETLERSLRERTANRVADGGPPLEPLTEEELRELGELGY